MCVCVCVIERESYTHRDTFTDGSFRRPAAVITTH